MSESAVDGIFRALGIGNIPPGRAARFKQSYLEHFSSRFHLLKPWPGVERLLEGLERQAVPVMVISGDIESTWQMLDMVGLRGYISAVLEYTGDTPAAPEDLESAFAKEIVPWFESHSGDSDLGLGEPRAKPHVLPEQVMVVSHTPNELAMAKAFGSLTC
jgi:phosphoglycolate phosphatase-like HAD superfamily hydrolase